MFQINDQREFTCFAGTLHAPNSSASVSWRKVSDVELHIAHDETIDEWFIVAYNNILNYVADRLASYNDSDYERHNDTIRRYVRLFTSQIASHIQLARL